MRLLKAIRVLFERSTSTASDQPDLLKQFVQAREEHVKDLRILLDKSSDREAELAGMVKMVMEERFYRPVITRDNTKPRQQAPLMPTESLNDTASFNSDEDTKRMQAHEELTLELEKEFQSIFTEHHEAHEEKGTNAISA